MLWIGCSEKTSPQNHTPEIFKMKKPFEFMDKNTQKSVESSSSTIEKKPKLLIFDLDYTLWPFWVDTHVTPPFRNGANNTVVDARGDKIQYYDNVPNILKKLHEDGYEIGIASRTSEIVGANQLLDLFDWNKYIKYKEIYPGCKITHIKKIHITSGIDYKDMIFFDDELRNIRDITSKFKVVCILVRNGVTNDVIKDALIKFSRR